MTLPKVFSLVDGRVDTIVLNLDGKVVSRVNNKHTLDIIIEACYSAYDETTSLPGINRIYVRNTSLKRLQALTKSLPPLT